MVGFLEPEEAVGRWWHRWLGGAESYPRYDDQAAQLDVVLPRLGVFFRGLGGPGALRLSAAQARGSRHRLGLRQRLAHGEAEPWEQARMDHEALVLPARIACFPSRQLNERLYFWLSAYFAHVAPVAVIPEDPLRADLMSLQQSLRAVDRTLAQWPGLRSDYGELCAAVRSVRPRRPLKGVEADLEAVIDHLLGGPAPSGRSAMAMLAAVRSAEPGAVQPFDAPRNYRTFLPVPLWGVVAETAPHGTGSPGSEEATGAQSRDAGERRRKARRRRQDQAQRDDALLLNRFETLLSVTEMINLNRMVEDDDPEAARRALDDMDQVTLSQHSRHSASRLKLDLELTAPEVDTEALHAECTYPEWDYQRGCYHRDHCRVLAQPAVRDGSSRWRPDVATRRRIRAVRRQFEALRPRRQVFSAQRDGDELDLASLVRSVADRRAGGAGSDQIYLQARPAARDLAVAVLMDVSLSTDAWVDNRRVLDVEKESVLALCYGLAACGDEHAVYAFSSRKRQRVYVSTVKDFREPVHGGFVERLQGLQPGYYTRMGAAVRHVSAQLARQPQRHRLLLLLSDGKPNDFDHYEGRYGVEDTRRAIRETRAQGMHVFGITIDRKARDYFPYLFGRGGYAMVARPGKLPAALPRIYRQLTG